MGRDQELKWLAFSLYPLSFSLYCPFKIGKGLSNQYHILSVKKFSLCHKLTFLIPSFLFYLMLSTMMGWTDLEMKKSEFVTKTYTPQETLEVIKMWVWNHKIRFFSYFKFCVKSKNKNSKHDSKFHCKKSFKNGLVLYGSLQLLFDGQH